MDSFFCPSDVLTGFLDNQVGILLGQLPVLGVTGQRALDRRQFVRRDMPGVILALLPALKF
jgi:hypothetical protein